jgi:hypothetical protein
MGVMKKESGVKKWLRPIYMSWAILAEPLELTGMPLCYDNHGPIFSKWLLTEWDS